MPFNFASFRARTPTNYTVLEASDQCLRIKHTKSGKIFKVSRVGNHVFFLHHVSAVDGTETCVMTNNYLNAILRQLGYKVT